MKPVTLDYHGMAIHATREAWFNATEIAEQHGKRMAHFFEQKGVQKYIHLVATDHGLNIRDHGHFDITHYPELIQTKRGKNGGTWLHPDLMIRFARFISIEFDRWCDQTIKALLIDGKSWQPAREEAATGYRLMSEVIHETNLAMGKVPSRFVYMNEAKRINRALTGKWQGLDRDRLTTADLRTIKQMEVKNAALYMMGVPAPERDKALSAIAANKS